MIIGIVLGAVGGCLVIIIIGLIIIWRRNREFDSKLQSLGNEMNEKPKDSWKQNEGHSEDEMEGR